MADCSSVSMAGTLYTYPNNFRAYKILIAAEYNQRKVKVVSEPPEFVLGQTNTTEEFLAKFPLGKVPAFETESGDPLYESNAITYYVSSPALKGTSELNAALVQQYVNFADNELLPSTCTWVFPTLGLMQYNKEATRVAQETIKKLLGVLNVALSTRTFLVGERVTLADISVCCNLLLLYKQVLDPQFRAPFVHVNRWFLTCVNQPQFKSVLGDITLCEKMAQFDAKKYAELFPKKEKKPAKPVQEKVKKPKAVALEPDEEEEDDTPKPSKFVDPFVSLPKSTFDVDTYKKVFCNEDPITVSIPYLWENFDSEGWSMWRCDYNYNKELTKVFMACNLLGGFFQRLEKLHKYGLSVMYVLGTNDDLRLSGVWILRGKELAFGLAEDWNNDAPWYTFKKLDTGNPTDQEFVNGFLKREKGEEFEGKKIADLKIFK